MGKVNIFCPRKKHFHFAMEKNNKIIYFNFYNTIPNNNNLKYVNRNKKKKKVITNRKGNDENKPNNNQLLPRQQAKNIPAEVLKPIEVESNNQIPKPSVDLSQKLDETPNKVQDASQPIKLALEAPAPIVKAVGPARSRKSHQQFDIRTPVVPDLYFLNGANYRNFQNGHVHGPEYRNLDIYSREYFEIEEMINDRNFVIHTIEKIRNPLLENAYNLRKIQKQAELPPGGFIDEPLFFHGTRHMYADEICTFNFNWSYCRKHKFGYGVCFSPSASYAAYYADYGYEKVMIVAKVMMTKTCLGRRDMEVPDEGCDASTNVPESVIIKYDDNEFLPMYKIYYHYNDRYRNQRQNSYNWYEYFY